MRRYIVYLVLIICYSTSTLSAKSKFVERDGHPNLMFSVDEIPQIKKSLKERGWMSATYESMLKDSERFMTGDYLPFSFSHEGEYWIGTCARALGATTINLAFTGYMTGNMEHIERSKEILLSAIRLTIPGVIQHTDHASDAVDEAYAANRAGKPAHWLTHLQNGDAGQAFALAYDLLYPFMSDSEIAECKAELEQMGEYLFHNGAFYANVDSRASACNHASVHFGALGLIALTLGDKEEWLEKSQTLVDAYYHFSADKDGYMMEGHSYMAYGMAGAYPFTHALNRIKGVDLVEKNYDFFTKYGETILWTLLPDDQVRVLNDNRNKVADDMAVMGALLTDQPKQLWAWLSSAHYFTTGVIPEHPMGSSYTRPYQLLSGNIVKPEPATDLNTPLYKYFDSGRVFMRSGWGDINDAHVTITSGYDAHRGHNHRDENNVAFYALGEDFLHDAEYEAGDAEFHSVLQINGNDMDAAVSKHGVVGAIEEFEDYGEAAFVRAESKTAYLQSTNIGRNNRKLLFVRDAPYSPYIIFRDDANTHDKQPGRYMARYITKPCNKVRQEGDGVVIEGGATGSKALLLVHSGIEPVKVREENLEGVPFKTQRVSKTFYYLNYIRRMTATVRAANPRFTTIVLPYKDESERPNIEIEEEGDDIIYTLSFTSGDIHTIRLSDTDIKLEIK